MCFIESLYASNNKIIEFELPPNIKKVDLYNNYISTFNVKYHPLPLLTDLNLGQNQLLPSACNFTNCNTLNNLILSSNTMSVIPFIPNTVVKLYIENDDIHTIP